MFDGFPDTQSALKAESFEELATIIEKDLLAQGRNLGLVCGPITTGGFGVRSMNMAAFSDTIDLHIRLGMCRMFDQRPYEGPINRLHQKWQKEHAGYCYPIIDVVYRRIIHSGYISHAFFIPGWKTSVGACREREYLKIQGAYINDLPDQWLKPEYEREMQALLVA